MLQHLGPTAEPLGGIMVRADIQQFLWAVPVDWQVSVPYQAGNNNTTNVWQDL